VSISESIGPLHSKSASQEEAQGPARALDRLLEAGLWVLLILTPLALGSVSATATALMEGGCFSLLVLAWWGGAGGNSAPLPRGIGATTALFVLWTLFQLVPLPPVLLGMVSPATHKLYTQNLPGYAEREKGTDLQSWLLSRPDRGPKGVAPRSGDLTGYEGRFRVRSGWRAVSWYPGLTLRWLSRLLAYWAVLVLIVRYLPEKACRKRIPWLVLLLGFSTALLGIVQDLTWNKKIFWVIPVYQGYPFGPWVNSNHFSGYMEMALPLGASVLMQSAGWGSRRWRRRRSRRSGIPRLLLVSFLLFCMACAMALARSRGGILALLLTLGAYLLAQTWSGRTRSRRPRLALLLAAVPLVIVLVCALWYTLHQGTLAPAAEPGVEPSFGTRLHAWKGVWTMVGANPLAGTGLGTFGFAYPVFGTYGITSTWLQAHNDYLQLLAESGGIGFVLFLVGLVIFAGRYLVPTLVQPWRKQDPVCLGAALGIVTLLVHSLVDFNLQIPSNGLLFVVVGGLLVRGGKTGWSGAEGDPRARETGAS